MLETNYKGNIFYHIVHNIPLKVPVDSLLDRMFLDNSCFIGKLKLSVYSFYTYRV